MDDGDSPDTTQPGLPFRQFIVKIHARCNLACDYCYVYRMADQRWRSTPAVMAPETIDLLARRVADHARAYQLPSVDVILHGGEPLLAGPRRIDYCVSRIRQAVGTRSRVRIGVQTNGTLLTVGYLELFRRLGVRVSLSLDGDGRANDRHRRDHRGRSTHDRVVAAARLLGAPRYQHLYAGLLCTVDLANEPIGTYRALAALHPPAIDFLLPHGSWSTPPPGRDPDSPTTPYGDWLVTAFNHWYASPRPRPGVRLFDQLIRLSVGGKATVEGVGLSPGRSLVIETDGALRTSDILAATHPRSAATGVHLATDGIDSAMALREVTDRQRGTAGLPTACRSCGIRRICGGGLYPHRYRRGHGFDNPSVYCPDLFRLIAHVSDRVARDVAALRERAG